MTGFGRVLIVDPDEVMARYIARVLDSHLLPTDIAFSAAEAQQHINQRRPQMVVLDPATVGYDFCLQLRTDSRLVGVPLIAVSASPAITQKLQAFLAGADDYIIKPFETLELASRIKRVRYRHMELRDVSPLTGLPGNTRIMSEIALRVSRNLDGGPAFAVCYLDVDTFKAINDGYGFHRGDELISALAEVLCDVVGQAAFVGHIGGDDFVIACEPGQVPGITQDVVARFTKAAAAVCDPIDVERGYLEIADRRGHLQRHPLPALSIGVARSVGRRYEDFREVIAVATEMKQVAKNTPGSVVAVDRRGDATDE